MPVNPELRYREAVLQAAKAQLRPPPNSDLKIAARRLMRAARRYLATLLEERD